MEVDDLIKTLEDSDTNVRKDAITALGNIGDASVLPALIEVLKLNDWKVREDVIEALQKVADKTAVPPLVAALSTFDARAAHHVARVLSRIDEPSAVVALIDALKNRSSEVRRSVAVELNLMCFFKSRLDLICVNSGAVPALIRALNDNIVGVRYAAVGTLGKINDERAVLPLIKALKDNGSEKEGSGTFYVRGSARVALANMGDALGLPAKVLFSIKLTPAEKLDTLEALRRVKYGGLRYNLPPIREYCQSELNDARSEDPAVAGWARTWAFFQIPPDDVIREKIQPDDVNTEEVIRGVEAVLAEIDNRGQSKILVRSTRGNPIVDVAELLRAATGDPASVASEQHLRPPEPPAPGEEKMDRFKRWFTRR